MTDDLEGRRARVRDLARTVIGAIDHGYTFPKRDDLRAVAYVPGWTIGHSKFDQRGRAGGITLARKRDDVPWAVVPIRLFDLRGAVEYLRERWVEDALTWLSEGDDDGRQGQRGEEPEEGA